MWISIKEKIREIISNISDYYQMLAHTNLPRVAMLMMLALLIGGAAIMVVEGQTGTFSNFFSSIWWVLVTMTTVGYGDMVPITPVGRVVATVIILAGVILISTFTATVSSIFVAAKIREGKGLQQIKYKDHIVVCGAGFIASQMFTALIGMRDRPNQKMVLIDEIPTGKVDELLSFFEPLKLKFVRGDWTHEEVLKRAKVMDARMVIILPDDKMDDRLKMDEKTILATLTVKGLNPKVRLIAQIMQRENRVFLQRAKADEVLVSDDYTGFLLATNMITTGVPEMIGEMLSFEGDNQLTGVEIPPEFVGSTFQKLSEHYSSKGSILIGLAKEENPLEAADILSADSSALDEFILRKFQEAGLDATGKARPLATLNPPNDTTVDKQDKAVIIQSIRVIN